MLGVLLAVVTATVAVASEPSRALHAALPDNPTPVPPEPVPVPPPSGPCADPAVRCPDLVLLPPSDLTVTHADGRLRLGMRNTLINRGAGPLFLLGKRDGSKTMSVTQRLYSVNGAHHDYPLANTHLDFWHIPGQGSYWKLRDGLRFELWRVDGPVQSFVERGPKTRFCMRDLEQIPGLPGPRVRQFPGCNQSPGTRHVRLGISVGWAESYPPLYYQQYVDVTGLRGCFSLRHIADPRQHVYESDESNNTSQVRIHLPPRDGSVRGC